MSWVVRVAFWKSSYKVKGDSLQLESGILRSFLMNPHTVLIHNLSYSMHIWHQTHLCRFYVPHLERGWWVRNWQFCCDLLLISFSVMYFRGGRNQGENDSMTLSVRIVVCTNYLFVLCWLSKVRNPFQSLEHLWRRFCCSDCLNHGLHKHSPREWPLVTVNSTVIFFLFHRIILVESCLLENSKRSLSLFFSL